jgi:acyl transferase domain-containing protein
MSLENSVAIIGLHGKFPKSPDLKAFWDHLKEGNELITFFSEEELSTLKDNRRNYVSAKGYLEEVECFDAPFFGYSPREAEYIDPQQRVLLECAWNALENAGYDPSQTQKRIGVFAGSSISTYFIFNVLPHLMRSDWHNPYTQSIAMTGNDKDFLSTRISYKLNLRGPSKTVQTACSTSLVAVHDACQNLLDYSCDMALAGGVSITCPPKTGYVYFKEGINSPDGHCRAFDANAQGTLIGNGAGIVVLKRLEDALNDRDSIHAIILGSAVNNDGNRKLGYTTPSIEGQSEVITEAIALSGINPETISYVETHGTGTIIGDPVEVKALTRAYQAWTDKKQFCAIGSVKTNIGHLDAAAGIAGLIKVVLSMKHGLLPPSLHYVSPNPDLHLGDSPFYVNHALQKWVSNESPRRAGVSSFGIGGTNAHIVLEEPPKVSKNEPIAPLRHLLTISAFNQEGLKRVASLLADDLGGNQSSLGNISYTLNTGRKHLPWRMSFLCTTKEEATNRLLALAESEMGQPPAIPSPVLYVFIDEAQGLNSSYPCLKNAIHDCLQLFKSIVKSELLGNRGINRENNLNDLEDFTLASFAFHYACSKLLQGLGVTPSATLGSGVGRFSAAIIAGVMNLDAALRCIAFLMKGSSDRTLLQGITLLPPSIPILDAKETSLTIPEERLLSLDYWLEEEATGAVPFFSEELFHPYEGVVIGGKSLASAPRKGSVVLNTDERNLLESLGYLWQRGHISTWMPLYEGCEYRRVPVPGYPFEKIPYWISPPKDSQGQMQTSSSTTNPINTPRSEGSNAVHSPLERVLLDIWKRTLKIEEINLEDNFFALGGDSLSALDIKDAICNQFYVDVPLQAFFDSPTVASMAERLQNQLLERLESLDETQTEKIIMFLEKS